MSAEFWAGYISGALGILIGNPLDVVKVRLQAGKSPTVMRSDRNFAALVAGTAAPMLGYGALNALLFTSYSRSEPFIQQLLPSRSILFSTWLAGSFGGLATWLISAPTELVKCRVQTSCSQLSSWQIARDVWRVNGFKGFYVGGTVTALRDSIGYGFYFWSYHLANDAWPLRNVNQTSSSLFGDAPRILVCGGIAGVITWASVFPLDTIKTRVQILEFTGQPPTDPTMRIPVTAVSKPARRLGAVEVSRVMFRESGVGVFFQGLTICCARAFIVNAVQWAMYEWAMRQISGTLLG